MTLRRLNAGFLSANELDAMGVCDAKNRNILVHSTAVIVNFDDIFFGENIRIDPYTVISCKNLVLGNHVHIATGCGLFGRATISMGDFSTISGHGLIYSSSDDYSGKALTNPTVPADFTSVKHAEVVIGRHCVIGARSTLLPGSQLEEGAAVGSSSLVIGTLPQWSISVGIPAKPIKSRTRDCLEHELTLEQWRQDQDV